MHTDEYISVLLESLRKKVVILDRIIEKNNVQRLILSENSVNADSFEENLNGKSALIEELSKLDDGFEQIFQRVKAVLNESRSSYKEEIAEMQKLITKITELTNTVQVQEQRNKELAEQKFAATKQKIRKVKTSNKVASQYYKNMSNLNYVDPQFMDSKK